MYVRHYQSPLRLLRLQCSDEHITHVLFADKETGVELMPEHPLLQRCADQLDEYFKGLRKEFSLPLQQEGTPFQKKVWEHLAGIPYGKTVSYKELSIKVGDVKAIRAVGTANGRNNLAILIPCHRVISSDATLTGYAGGLWRKKWLLNHEARYHSGVQQLF